MATGCCQRQQTSTTALVGWRPAKSADNALTLSAVAAVPHPHPPRRTVARPVQYSAPSSRHDDHDPSSIIEPSAAKQTCRQAGPVLGGLGGHDFLRAGSDCSNVADGATLA